MFKIVLLKIEACYLYFYYCKGFLNSSNADPQVCRIHQRFCNPTQGVGMVEYKRY